MLVCNPGVAAAGKTNRLLPRRPSAARRFAGGVTGSHITCPVSRGRLPPVRSFAGRVTGSHKACLLSRNRPPAAQRFTGRLTGHHKTCFLSRNRPPATRRFAGSVTGSHISCPVSRARPPATRRFIGNLYSVSSTVSIRLPNTTIRLELFAAAQVDSIMMFLFAETSSSTYDSPQR